MRISDWSSDVCSSDLNNMIYGIDPHDYSRKLIIAFNSAYGAQKKHGIIGSRGVDDSYFIGNLAFGNHGTGMMLDRFRSEERRVGKACVSTCRSRLLSYH